MILPEQADRVAAALEIQTHEEGMARAYAFELLSNENSVEEKLGLIDELDGCEHVSHEVQQLIDEIKGRS